MGITIGWANAQKTIALYIFQDPWNWDEFYACWDWLTAALDASAHPVSMLMDLRDTRMIPRDSLQHLNTILEQIHPNFSHAAAVVGLGGLSLIYKTMLKQMHPALADEYQVFFASTLEEATVLLDDWHDQHARKSE